MTKAPSSMFVSDTLLEFVAAGRAGGAAYFSDGVRKVHYALVVSRQSSRRNYATIQDVLRQLEDFGLEFEQDYGIGTAVNFIKIHMSNEVALQLMDCYNIQKEYLEDFSYVDPNPREWTFFKTPILNQDPFANEKMETLSVNKMRIIFTMLKFVSFGPEYHMHGIAKLKRKGIFKDAYPMHDGKIQIQYWHNDNLINERTLLAKYWGSVSQWYKVQPFNLIHKYYGAEIALYYAWADFYDKVFYVPLAIIGVLIMLYNFTNFNPICRIDRESLCKSDKLMCDTCIFQYGCAVKPLKAYCSGFVWIDVTERVTTIVFSLAVSIWGLVVSNMWKRREATLKYRWNLFEESGQEQAEIRVEYKELAKNKVVNGRSTFEMEKRTKYSKRMLACLWYMSMILLVVGFLYLKQGIVVLLKLCTVAYSPDSDHNDLEKIIIGVNSTLTALFTIYFSKLVFSVSEKMTNAFLPRTQADFDKMVVVLPFTLDIFNVLAPLSYTTFFKSKNTNIPQTHGSWYYGQDDCDPFPCIYELQVQFLIYLTLKTLIEKILVILTPKLKKMYSHYFTEQLKQSSMPQYEEEYNLIPTSRNMIKLLFSKRCIQYFLGLCFVYSLPVAHFFIVVNNLLATRIDAKRLIHDVRRPPSIRHAKGIGIWHTVILNLTFIGAVVNIMVISFSGQIIDLFHLKFITHKNTGTIMDMFSEFEPKSLFGESKSNFTTCWFHGQHFPPGTAKQYQYNLVSYQITDTKYKFFILGEALFFISFIVVSLLIRTTPLHIKKLISVDRTNLINEYNTVFNKKLEIAPPGYKHEQWNESAMQVQTATDDDSDVINYSSIFEEEDPMPGTSLRARPSIFGEPVPEEEDGEVEWFRFK